MKIDRVEIWTDVAANSGTHQSTIPKNDLLTATLDEDIDGKSILELTMARSSAAWSSVVNHRVLRVIFDGGDIMEFRISRAADGRSKSGKESAGIKGLGILMDLGNGIVSRDEADDTVTLYYTLLGLTRTELVTLLVAAAPSYFALGTITSGTTKVDTFTFNYDTPLSALQELAALEGLELAVRRNGDTSYYVDLIEQVGSSATQPEFRYRKNLAGVRREIDSSKMANRLYPAGGDDGVIRLSVAEATWEVTATPTTTTFDLADDPIYEDDVLNSLYIERVSDGSTFQITDTDATLQRVTTGAAHGLNVGDLIKFRLTSGGKRLTYVESQVQQATYGVISGVVEESDLPLVDNMVVNPALRDWTAGDPDNWVDIGAPTVTEETSSLYSMVGGSSAKCVCTDGQGLRTDAITIAPSDPHVFFSAFVSIYVESGEVELYLDHSTEGRFPIAGYQEAAVTNEHNKFVSLIIAGKEYPAGTVTLNVVARNGAATFYIDSAQLTNTATEYPFFDGNAARVLWQRGLEELDNRAIPVSTYDINTVDLYAADSTNFPYDEITLGGNVLVEDEVLSYQVVTRAIGITRDLLTAHTTNLTLSNKPVDIIDILTKRRRRVRHDTASRPSIATIENLIVSHEADGSVVLQVFGGAGCRSFMYIVDTSVMPTFAEVIASGGNGITNNTVDGTEITVTAIRDTPSNAKLGRNNRCYVRVVAFPILSAGGVAGATATGTIMPTNLWDAEIINSSVVQHGDATTGDAKVVRTYEPDNRTASIRVFRRKGNWPTTDNTQTGPLDSAYDRGTISDLDEWKYSDGGWTGAEVVYDIAIAYDINNTQGEREEDSYTVVNTGSGDPRITSATRTQTAAGTNCSAGKRNVRIDYTCVDVADGTHDLKLYRQIDSGPKILVTTITTGIASGNYTDTAAPMWGYPSGGYARQCDYILDLIVQVGGAVLDTRRMNETHTQPKWNLCETPE